MRAIQHRLPWLERRAFASEGAGDISIWWIGDDGQRMLGQVAAGDCVDYRRGLASLLGLADTHDKTGSIESDAS